MINPITKESQCHRGNKTPKIKADLSEHDLTVQCEQYLHLKGIKFMRIPDSLNNAIFAMGTRIAPHVRYHVARYTAGVPDFTVLFKSGMYACIELKVGKNDLSAKQDHFKDKVSNFFTVRSFVEFKEIIDSFDKGNYDL